MHSRQVVAALAAVTACVALASVAALDPSKCTAQFGTNLQLNSCGTGTASAGSKTTLSFMAGADIPSTASVNILVWNKNQFTTGWPNTLGAGTIYISTPTADRAASTPPNQGNFGQIFGTTAGSSPQAITFGFSYTIAAPVCLGEYKIVIDGTTTGFSDNMGYGVYLWTTDSAAPPAVVSAKNSLSVDGVLPGGSTTAWIDADFNQVGFPYIVAEVDGTITTDSSLALANLGWSISMVSSGGGGSMCTTTGTLTAASNVLTGTCMNTVRSGTNLMMLSVTAPSITNTAILTNGYNWATNGPFLPITLGVSVKEYDTLGSSDTSVTLDATNSWKLFKLPTTYPWWLLSVAVSNVQDTTASPSVTNSYPTVTFATWSANGYTSVSTAPNYGTQGMGSYQLTNTNFFSGGLPVTNQLLSPAKLNTPQFYFVKVAKGGCDAPKINFNIHGSSTTLTGQCNSYADCNPSNGKGPGSSSFSTNDDASRLRQCVVAIDTAGSQPNNILPTTKCAECFSDCDCGQGQYCNVDNGICNRNGINWLCDVDMANRYGMCLQKSTNVLGAPCRTNAFTSVGSAMHLPYATTVNGQPLVVPGGSSAGYAEKADPVGGFCGEVRLFNSTNIGTVDSTVGLPYAGQPRRVLWIGSCVNQVCMECAPGFGPVAGLTCRSCYNGMLLDNVIVDWTVRTYTKNTIAGTALGVVFMFILVSMCVCTRILLAWRSSPVNAASKQ